VSKANQPDLNEANRAEQPAALDDPRLFINRELSWLQFNHHVLEEALNTSLPLLERVKFMGIYAVNLDEFFMIRVSGLRRQLEGGALEAPPDEMTPAEQLAAIRKYLLPELDLFYQCWRDDLQPALAHAGVRVQHVADLKEKTRYQLRDYFERECFPTITPLAIDPAHPFPHISNLSMNLAVLVQDPVHGERFARVKLPDSFPRLLRISKEDTDETYDTLGLEKPATNRLVWFEDLVAANLDMLFPGMKIVAAYPFRVTRDADIEIEEDEASDLMTAIEQGVGMRYFGSAVRLEVDRKMPASVRDLLARNLDLAPFQVYAVDGPIGLGDVLQLMDVERPDLRYKPFVPAVPAVVTADESLFDTIRRRDILLYHPYDSFATVVDFLQEAANDPKVLAIKQTLYRADRNSPIIGALMKARENGKQVAVMVELKARFDEENNIVWARELDRAGVHVVYGLVGLKTHCKVLLVVRKEEDGIRRYLHVSTGNYNTVTARIYADLSFFTCDPDMGADVADLFNALTGYSNQTGYRKLLVAPAGLRQGVIDRIEREIETHAKYGNGYLAFKVNSLVDKAIIQALYRASQAGVKIDLQVRGICSLVPGLPGVSENITITCIVGRFLEHTRILYFGNNGQPEVLLGSADLMPRNLDRRVEQLFPVEDKTLKEIIFEQILKVHLRDTFNARQLRSDGSYVRVVPANGELPFDSQQWMIDHRGSWNGAD